MLLSFDQCGLILDDMADKFPEAFYAELNGGIALLPDCITEEDSPDLYTMGSYCVDELGRYILLYHGSFVALAEEENWDEKTWHQELWETLAHEFTHHVESLAGERGLEIKDEIDMLRFKDESP